MKKELMVCGVVFLFMCILLSGCAQQTATKEKTESPTIDKPPIIDESRVEYFDRNNSATRFFVGSASDIDGTVVLYTWNLSDGFTTNEQSFIHSFAQPGVYQARFTVMDDKGLTNTSLIIVYVNETSP